MSNVRCLQTGQLESKAVFESLKDVTFKELLVIGIDEEGYLFINGMSDKLDESNALLDIAKSHMVGLMYDSVKKS